MSYQQLGLLGVGLALAFWSLTLILRHWLFGQPLHLPAAAVELAILLAGALIFWRWIARRLQVSDARLREQTQRLQTLHQAGLSITTETELDAVLQSVVDESRRLIGARYGALGVLGRDGSDGEDGEHITSFIVSGLEPEIHARLASHPPQGRGLLGLAIQQRRSIRVDHIADHPASVGFPAHHPPMESFLGVPIGAKGKIYGHLYLTDKYRRPPDEDRRAPTPGSASPARAADAAARAQVLPFDADDETLLEMFATQAAIAIENATLYQQSREVAVLRERERFGMDLHDGVIQSIYAAGLLLDDGIHRLAQEPALAGERMREASTRLNTVIADIRRYIHDLRTQARPPEPTNLQAELEQLIHSLRSEGRLDVRWQLDPPTLRRLTPRQSAELLQIIREALANIRRHAQASHVSLRLESRAESLELEVIDDGNGFDAPATPDSRGQGLRNMQTRAQALNGTLYLDTAPGQGCRITLSFPVTSRPL